MGRGMTFILLFERQKNFGMKTIGTPQPPEALAGDQAENHRKFEALCQLIELGQGSFALALVEFDLPRVQRQVLDSLRRRFPV